MSRAGLAALGAAFAVAAGVRLWNALAGPLMWGYDAWGHVAYVLFLDVYGAFPRADQGWSTYQPPLHYALGWGLAKLGSAEALVRGLSLLASFESLAVAGIAAWVARWLHPGRPGLAAVAFVAVAFLPVHFALSWMPGNEMTVALLNAAAIASFVATERSAAPSLVADARTAMLLGLAALAKHSGLLPAAAVAGTLALRPWLAADRRSELRRSLARAARIAAVAALVAGPHYLRNVELYGTAVPSNRDYALVADVEADQPPGTRSPGDYLRFPLRALLEPNPLAPHMLTSVWGSLYTNLWWDTHRESDRGRALLIESGIPPAAVVLLFLGLAPTGLALAGAALCARDVRRGRRRFAYVPLLLLSAAMLAAFAVFAWMVPRWAALKASYCLSLSVPFGVFLARAVEALAARGRALGAAAVAALVVPALAAAATAPVGAVLEPRRDAPAMGAVYYVFGEYPAARRLYGRLVEETVYKAPWLENLAAVELAAGRPDRARRLIERAGAIAERRGLGDPRNRARRGVAAALAGDLASARRDLDATLAVLSAPDLLANRGLVRLAQDDLAGAEGDLRAAAEAEPTLVPAWLGLEAWARRTGDPERAREARRRAGEAACAPPRGYPYGVGTGEVLEWGVGRRPLLLPGEPLGLALPDFHRTACARLGGTS